MFEFFDLVDFLEIVFVVFRALFRGLAALVRWIASPFGGQKPLKEPKRIELGHRRR